MNNTHLSTQLKVNHHYGNLGDTAGENQEHQKQETKQVVKLVFPDGLKTDNNKLHPPNKQAKYFLKNDT